jgi:hypothetical protein
MGYFGVDTGPPSDTVVKKLEKPFRYPTTISSSDGKVLFNISANGEGMSSVLEVAKLLDVEQWSAKTMEYVFDADGQTSMTTIDLPEVEVTYDFDEAARERIRKEFSGCLSLSDAFRCWTQPRAERLKGRTISIEQSQSAIWHSLFRVEKLFQIRRFHWVELAEQCCYIAELEMAGADVKPLYAKVHQIISIWEEYLK